MLIQSISLPQITGTVCIIIHYQLSGQHIKKMFVKFFLVDSFLLIIIVLCVERSMLCNADVVPYNNSAMC